MRKKAGIGLIGVALAGCATSPATYVSAREFTSMFLTEACSLYTKMVSTTPEGKVRLIYRTRAYDSATNLENWEEKVYWTWERDLPDWVRGNLKR